MSLNDVYQQVECLNSQVVKQIGNMVVFLYRIVTNMGRGWSFGECLGSAKMLTSPLDSFAQIPNSCIAMI